MTPKCSLNEANNLFLERKMVCGAHREQKMQTSKPKKKRNKGEKWDEGKEMQQNIL